MPYIKRERRNIIKPETPGELNFLITKMILKYLGKSPNYSLYNEVIGVLECVKLELYRRKISQYEEKKILGNGDIY